MPAMTNREVRLRRRPVGEPAPDDFELVETPVPPVGEGQILRRTIYLSLDPYMRGRMSDAPSYAKSVDLGQRMVGATVSQVIESRHPAFAMGDYVAGSDGWQMLGVSDGTDLRKLDPAVAPISTAVGVLGMPGLTAYVGLLDIGKPKPGETVVVSAASGAVGAVVGQIAKIKGCRVVGVAGAREKCDYVVRELGFDACVSHQSQTLFDDLKAACPNGIDVYFENVGGAVFAAVIRLMNVGARIPLCGLISQYNAPTPPPAPNLRPFLTKRAMLQGFIIFDHAHRQSAFLEECGAWVRSGQIKYREDIVEGLEHAPAALIGLLKGTNFGKLLVRVSADPTRGG
jgi:hypothetical protein